jgi:hypothetical protein
VATDNDAAVVSAIAGVTGAAAGALAAWAGVARSARASERIAQQNAAHEREMAERTWRTRLDESRRAEQRDTLLALQDALAREIRAAGAIHHEDVVAFRTGASETFGRQQISDHWNDESFHAGVEVRKLRERVQDDELRALVSMLREKLVRVKVARDEQQAEARMTEAMTLYEAATEQLGLVLRSL